MRRQTAITTTPSAAVDVESHSLTVDDAESAQTAPESPDASDELKLSNSTIAAQSAARRFLYPEVSCHCLMLTLDTLFLLPIFIDVS